MKINLWYVLIFFISVISVSLYRWFAVKRTILDLPNERSSHVIPTPRGGGLAIAIIWFSAIIFYYIRNQIDSSLFFALLCGLPVSVIGFADDIFKISPKIRLIIHVVSGSLALVFLGGINMIDLGFTRISVPFLFSILAVIGIVWFTNLFNFLDGIDGYISVEVIFICLASFLLFGMVPPVLLATIIAGFLVWNWQPAKIFMGDGGSTLLGFTVGVFAIYYQKIEASSVISWLMLSSVFWFDATFTLFRRWRNHENLSKAHKNHAYQRIVRSGFSHRKTVLFSLFINLIILALVWIALKFQYLLLPVFCLNIVFLYILTRIVDKYFPFPKHNVSI
jgi:UDP-N-acetylmuramyl pentapeptide phosphotransferase/UDP-N-acetylglucosamine-1-phosphate transferase